jgi:hypothetical protein
VNRNSWTLPGFKVMLHLLVAFGILNDQTDRYFSSCWTEMLCSALGWTLENDNVILYFQPLRDIAVVSGQNARFECIVQAEPPPNILWSKNGRIIDNSQNYQIQYRNGVCRLTIPQAFPGKCRAGVVNVGYEVINFRISTISTNGCTQLAFISQ